MRKIIKALAWLNDVLQVLFLYRFNAQRRRLSEQASTACRSLKFHATSKIRQLPLREIVAKLSDQPVDQVVLPGPATDLGEVGSQTAYHTLGTLVRAIQPATIFETGTYLGVSAYAMALNTPESCRIYTLDLPDDAAGELVPGLNKIDVRHVATSRLRVGEAFLRSSLKHRVTQLRDDSMTFRAETVMKNVDLIYVDGGHSLEVVTKDTENAFRVLAARGVIVWDDYFHLYPDVVQYLDGLANQYQLFGIEGTNYVIYSRNWPTPVR